MAHLAAVALLLLLLPSCAAAPAPCPQLLDGVCFNTPHYKELPAGGPAACCAACSTDASCRAWTFFSTGALPCHLKVAAAHSVRCNNGTSGAVGGGPAPAPPPPPPPPPKTRHNVLMIAMDDLRPVGKLFGEPEVLVPNLDRLAERSTIFTNAFAQSPTCGVSRSSLLTGRRPDTTYVLDNGGCPFTSAPAHGTWQSLPQYFRAAGYVKKRRGGEKRHEKPMLW